jgi:hypothetical protein
MMPDSGADIIGSGGGDGQWECVAARSGECLPRRRRGIMAAVLRRRLALVGLPPNAPRTMTTPAAKANEA